MKGNFNTIINSEKPVLVDFFAEWCGPCKAQSPIIDNLAKEVGDRARIIKIDIDKNNDVASAHHVRGVPTLILFKNGETKWRQSGVQTKQTLLQVINENI